MSRPAAFAPDLAAALARCLAAPPPFYRDRLAGAGVVPSDAVARLPLTRRMELLRDQLAHLPHGTRRLAGAPAPVRAGITGTGPELLVLAWSAAELARERVAGARLLGGFGIRAGMRVANTLAGALVTPGALLLGDVVEDIGALDVPLGAIEGDAAARQAWELVDRVHPEVLILEHATAERFLATAPGGTRPWWRGIVWLRRGAAGASARPPAPAGFTGWQRTWLAVPEATSFVAGSCARGAFHVDEALLAEVVDEATGAPAGPGRDGTLALTVPDGDAPLLRFASGVRARLRVAACPCGVRAPALELP